MDFRVVAEPVLRKLRDDTGLEGIIGVLDQSRVMVINRVASGAFPNADVDTGTQYAAYATAIGKVLLAHIPEEHLLELVGERDLIKFTPKTISSTADLLEELGRVRKSGYAISDEEQIPGVRSVAAPIVDSQRAVRAGVAAVGTTEQLVWHDAGAVVERVRAMAREISRLVRFK